MNGLTVVILTKNEAKHIVDAIKNAQKVTEHILIVDSGSTDRTVELAEANGAKVVYRAWDNDFAAQRNFALEQVDTEWVLYLDADERMHDALIDDIRKHMAENKPALYRFIRRNSAFGKDFKYGVLGPDSVKRMFPKREGKWQGKVHESVVCKLPVVTLAGYLQHYTYADFEQYVAKMNQYSSIAAVNNFEKGKRASVLGDMICRPLFAFIKTYFLKLGILEGWLGLVLCFNYANYTLNKYVKLKLLEEQKQRK